jgi:6,7-dimethyl-8-ribityllumazine synthase
MMPNILIVEARFYDHIADQLLDGATAALEAGGAHFERKSYDGFVALGCVIRGETYHFEIVSGESARGLMELGLHHGLCIGNGVLTCENEEQALARASRDGQDKGGDAARACLALISIRAKLGAHR